GHERLDRGQPNLLSLHISAQRFIENSLFTREQRQVHRYVSASPKEHGVFARERNLGREAVVVVVATQPELTDLQVANTGAECTSVEHVPGSVPNASRQKRQAHRAVQRHRYLRNGAHIHEWHAIGYEYRVQRVDYRNGARCEEARVTRAPKRQG